MEQLTIDTGLREYAVNGGPEHGGGVLRFKIGRAHGLNSSHYQQSRMPSSA